MPSSVFEYLVGRSEVNDNPTELGGKMQAVEP